VGMRLQAPEIARVTPTLVIEGDFFGNQPGQPHDESETTEAAFYDSPTFRLRHGFVHLANPIADLTFGQTYDLFAWQNYFYPATAEFLGIPSMAFSRPLKVKAVREFGRNGPIGVDVGLAAVRPVQRDGEVPDLRAGVRFKVNKFRGLSVPGNGDPFHRALALGVSGTTRQLKVDAFTPPPTQ